MLSDYELQSSYVPRLGESRIVARRSPVETDVEYVVRIPVFPNERSVSRQRVSRDSGEYVVRWQTVVADSTIKQSMTVGRATFVPMANSRSVDPALS